MQKVIIFGAGSRTRCSLGDIKKKYDVIGIVDNDPFFEGKELEGYKIQTPESIISMSYDNIILSNRMPGITIEQIDQLSSMGIPQEKMIFDYCEYITDARVDFLKSLSKCFYERNIKGSVAECGVYKGEFSKWINILFPDRSLYLFDTFEGFSVADLDSEDNKMQFAGRLSDTSEELVLSKMKYPDKIIVKKGLFPNTANGISDEFCFVNLDMDLEKPTIEGLNFFHNKMVHGGVIMVHDYFNEFFEGVKRGVDKWLLQHNKLYSVPIGDSMSIIILGF